MHHYQNKFKLPISRSDRLAISKELKVIISPGLGAESQSPPGPPGSTSTKGRFVKLTYLSHHVEIGGWMYSCIYLTFVKYMTFGEFRIDQGCLLRTFGFIYSHWFQILPPKVTSLPSRCHHRPPAVHALRPPRTQRRLPSRRS